MEPLSALNYFASGSRATCATTPNEQFSHLRGLPGWFPTSVPVYTATSVAVGSGGMANVYYCHLELSEKAVVTVTHCASQSSEDMAYVSSGSTLVVQQDTLVTV
eukprot:2529181-Rhodomonas_salina.2